MKSYQQIWLNLNKPKQTPLLLLEPDISCHKISDVKWSKFIARSKVVISWSSAHCQQWDTAVPDANASKVPLSQSRSRQDGTTWNGLLLWWSATSGEKGQSIFTQCNGLIKPFTGWLPWIQPIYSEPPSSSSHMHVMVLLCTGSSVWARLFYSFQSHRKLLLSTWIVKEG